MVDLRYSGTRLLSLCSRMNLHRAVSGGTNSNANACIRLVRLADEQGWQDAFNAGNLLSVLGVERTDLVLSCIICRIRLFDLPLLGRQVPSPVLQQQLIISHPDIQYGSELETHKTTFFFFCVRFLVICRALGGFFRASVLRLDAWSATLEAPRAGADRS